MIPVLPLRLDFKLGSDARLPEYLGSLWRSAVGATLRQRVCITGAPTCDGCHLLQRCGYGFLFNTPQPAQVSGLPAQYSKPQVPQPPAAPDTVHIDLEHPLRLRRKNQYLKPAEFDFGTFFTTLIRRISMLHALTGGPPLEMDAAALASHARGISCQPHHLNWHDWARESARQKKRIPMGGIIGSVQLSGDIAPLWPWLWAGQWLHVGKGAVMGLGRYQLRYA